MDFKKYLNVIWLYAIGLVLIFSGIYMIAFMGGGPSGFGFMVAGLMFSTIGGFYGKKKLMEGSNPVQMEDRQMDMLKQNIVSQVRVKPSSQAAAQAQDVHGSVQADWDDAGDVPDISAGVSDMPAIQAIKSQTRPVMKAQPAMAAASSAAQTAVQPSSPDGNAIVKIMVCPDCNTENPPTNMYCSSCGKRLRKPDAAKKPAAASKPAVAKKKASKPKKKAPQQATDDQQ